MKDGVLYGRYWGSHQVWSANQEDKSSKFTENRSSQFTKDGVMNCTPAKSSIWIRAKCRCRESKEINSHKPQQANAHAKCVTCPDFPLDPTISQDSRFLHFEMCFYTPIEYSIRKGWRRFEPGAGTPRSRESRGFEGVSMHSVHFFCDPKLHSTVSERLRLARERDNAPREDKGAGELHERRTVLRGSNALDSRAAKGD